MKKFFFFRSSSPSSGNNNQSPPKFTSAEGDKSGNNFRSPRGSKTRKQVFDSQPSGDGPCLRRSLSSSAALFRFPSNGSNNSHKLSDRRSSRCRTPTPERQSRPKCFETAIVQNAYVVEKPGSANCRGPCDSSESSSFCSSNFSSTVVDRYIDGEQEFSLQQQRNHIGNLESAGKRPPRVQSAAPTSPTNSTKDKPNSCSFRETRGGQHHFSSREWVENGFGHESPRSLAKHVIERLSQSHALPKTNSEEQDPGFPITIEDIYGRSLNRCHSSNHSGSLVGHDEITNGFKEMSDFQNNCLPHDNCGAVKSVKDLDDIDVELMRKSKEAEERVWLLSEELEQDDFLAGTGFSVPALIQTIRNLFEERVSMAQELSAGLQAQIADRASATEEIKLLREDLYSRTRRLEKEKTELQSTLEQEIDRRSNDWSFKLEKYQTEEHRLRERVRELAEQNVSLQRDVSSFSEMEMESRSRITGSEMQLKDLTSRMEEMSVENQHLLQNLSVLQEKYRAVEDDQECMKRNYEDKEKECKELHRSVSRLLRTCNEQENTVDGLRKCLSEEVGKKSSPGNFEKQLAKLQMEQIRLTGVELALRKEVESCRIEVDSLRHENINLLHRLKVSGKECGFPTYKLDRELLDRVGCIQNQGLSLLNESTQLCTKLLEYTKLKAAQTLEIKHCNESIQNGLDGQFVIESDMKFHSIKRGTESLRRSLQTISSVLDSKSKPAAESNLHCFEDRPGQFVDQNPEDTIRSELKAETLLTSVLREKLYAKEVQMEQMQAELAAAVRGNDMLRCEVQNAMDNLSCMSHKMKDLELKIIKKDENINRLEDDLQECRKELTIVRGILPKVSEERDMLWEDVKKHNEKNMLMNSEINMLKKKVEALDEDILLKEGQITILKDTLGKPFDLLASPDSMRGF